jgi:hypothetical protein
VVGGEPDVYFSTLWKKPKLEEEICQILIPKINLNKCYLLSMCSIYMGEKRNICRVLVRKPERKR